MITLEEQGIYQLVYRSRSALIGSDASVDSEVSSILHQSGRNNLRAGVTGALMFTASVFIQVLEGRCTDIEQTFERICCDVRHLEVELMSFSPVPGRTFGNWHMHRVHADAAIEALCRQLGEATASASNNADAVSRAVAMMAAVAAEAPGAAA